MTGITTVGKFHRRDMALGGQGASLVPAFDHALMAHAQQRYMLLNIGSVTNLSMLLQGQPICGYDTSLAICC